MTDEATLACTTPAYPADGIADCAGPALLERSISLAAPECVALRARRPQRPARGTISHLRSITT
jgi:hypothetical protein